MAKTVTVSSKGQITLPKELRIRRRLAAGSTVFIHDTAQGALVRRGRHSLRGLVKTRVDVDKVEREIRALRKEWTLRPAS